MANLEKSKDISTQVLNRLETMKSAGEINLPTDFSPENALKSAQLHLSELTTKDNKPVLEACTTASIANALLKMVVQGLSVAKNQCYFIPYGDKLNYQRSYFGSIALAKRVAGVVNVVPVVIYEGDEFEFGIDVETGYRQIIKHKPAFKNIDTSAIKGAYCVVHYADGHKEVEIMTIQEIEQAWQQGATKGASPAHKNFRQEMSKKTVINRALKEPINSSDDSHLLFSEDFPKENNFEDISHEEITEIKFENAKEIKEEIPKPTQKQQEVKSFSEKMAERNNAEKMDFPE